MGYWTLETNCSLLITTGTDRHGLSFSGALPPSGSPLAWSACVAELGSMSRIGILGAKRARIAQYVFFGKRSESTRHVEEGSLARAPQRDHDGVGVGCFRELAQRKRRLRGLNFIVHSLASLDQILSVRPRHSREYCCEVVKRAWSVCSDSIVRWWYLWFQIIGFVLAYRYRNQMDPSRGQIMDWGRRPALSRDYSAVRRGAAGQRDLRCLPPARPASATDGEAKPYCNHGTIWFPVL